MRARFPRGSQVEKAREGLAEPRQPGSISRIRLPSVEEVIPPAPKESDSAKNIPDDLVRSSWLQRLQQVAIFSWTTAASYLFFQVVNQHYPIEQWLFVRHLSIWAGAAAFFISSWSVGHLLVSSLLKVSPRLSERLIFDFTLGAIVFAMGVFLAGLAGLLNRTFFFLWPAFLLLIGLPRLLPSLSRARRQLRSFGLARLLPSSPLSMSSVGLLLLGCLALYLQVLLPQNLGGDAHGYHLPIAEHYVAEGAIRPFVEGWYLGAYPQLASLYYTWALLIPGSGSMGTALASQLEWVFFVMTLAAIAPLVRRLIKSRAPYSAGAFFLFPGIFTYDSNLVTTADHILAFFTLPLALSLLTLSRRFGGREAALSALILSAGLLTKYQGVFLLVGALPVVFFLTLRERKVVPVLVFVLVGLLATSPHWAKNWVFYNNPVYPFLGEFFASRPFHAGAQELFVAKGPVPVMPPRSSMELLSALWNFSLIPEGTKMAPRFGSLFTLCSPLLLLVRPGRRLWLVFLSIYACLILWLSSYSSDRFLQIFSPLMAVSTVSVLLLSWPLGRMIRAGLTLLVGLQLVWGADIYFLAKHRWIHQNPLKAFVDHVGKGYEGKHEQRDAAVGSLVAFNERLPDDAKLLVHGLGSGQLGAGTRLVNDTAGWQGAISYLELDSPQATFALWKKIGVTHSVWRQKKKALSRERLAEELIFRRAIFQYGKDLGTVSGRRFFSLNDSARDHSLAKEDTRIAWLGCDFILKSGLYTAKGLAAHKPLRRFSQKRGQREKNPLKEATALLVKDGCAERRWIRRAAGEFEEVGRAAEFSLWIRKKVSDAATRQ